MDADKGFEPLTSRVSLLVLKALALNLASYRTAPICYNLLLVGDERIELP
jgi:hypothetical protein